MKQTHYFLGIDHPITLRKNLLESAKLSVFLLRSQYKLRDIRERKQQLVKELSSLFGEMNILMDRLEKQLPAHSMKEMPPRIRKKLMKLQHKESTKKHHHKPTKRATTPVKKTKRVKKTVKRAKKAATKHTKKAARKTSRKKPVKKSKEKAKSAVNELEEKLSNIESKLSKLR